MAIFAFCALLLSAVFAGHSIAQTQPLADGAASTAAANNAEFPPWLRGTVVGVGLLSGPGIAVWYLWYDVRYAKPRQERAHNEERQKMEERHAANWALATANARSDLQGLMAALTKLAEAMNERACKYEGSSHGSRS